MGFGGVQGMITSLKNNSNLIGRRKKYFNQKGETKYLKTRTNFKKASPELINKIREKSKKENRKARIIQIIFLIIIITLVIYLNSF